MQTNSSAPVRVLGIDVSQKTLDGFVLPEESRFQVSNDDEGIKQLVTFIKQKGIVLIVAEASGGFEIPVVAALAIEKLPIVVVQPKRIRDFARALGFSAKTDALDAKVIALFGQSVKPPVRPLPEEKFSLLSHLVVRRRQILDMLLMENNRRNSAVGPVRTAIENHIAWLEKELDNLEKGIQREIEQSDLWKHKVDILRSMKSVGPVLASTIIAELPELGAIDKKKIAALVGVCPFNRDSGKWKVERKKNHTGWTFTGTPSPVYGNQKCLSV